MSANQSNLSNPQYGYDMVVSTTQAAVNATMEEWLSKYTGTPFIQAYVFDPNHPSGQSGAVLTDYNQLVADIGFDPFTIPNNTPITDDRIQKLMNKKFMFAFQVQIGIPDFPLEQIPPVIQFNKEGSYVTYNMVCQTFKIIVIDPGLYNQATWINLSQDTASAPWVFSFTIDLDLQSDNINNHFSKLPPDLQQQIKNLGENMFSIQQLFLDLNAAGLSNSVTINGLSPTSQAYVMLTEVFLNTYLADLSKNGGVMLGFGVVSQQPFPQNVSLIPTNLNFEISSFKDQSGKATTDYNAYTLNYLIMSKGHSMPAPTQFMWNWVELNELSQEAGVMAVNRNTFVDFLNNLLSPSLSDISKIPTTHFHVNFIEADFSWSYQNDNGPFAFNTVQNGGSHVLTYSYSKSASDSDTFVPNWGNFGVDYTVQSDVYLQGTTIKVVTVLNMHCHVNVDGGVTDGNWAKYQSEVNYNIGVDTHGQISVSQSGPTITDQSEKPDPDWWSKLITLGQITSVASTIQSSLQGWLNGFLNSDASDIANMLNGSSSWVFPGSQTFSFTNAAFSDNQDLVADILYVAPESLAARTSKKAKSKKAVA